MSIAVVGETLDICAIVSCLAVLMGLTSHMDCRDEDKDSSKRATCELKNEP